MSNYMFAGCNQLSQITFAFPTPPETEIYGIGDQYTFNSSWEEEENANLKLIVPKGYEEAYLKAWRDAAMGTTEVENSTPYLELRKWMSKSGRLTEEELDADELAAGQARFSDPAWIYGDSQPLEVSREAAFTWGILRVDHSQANGSITQAALWSDGLEGDFLSLVPEALAGCPKNAEDIRTRLSALPGSQAEMVEDILSLLIKE